MAAGLARFVLEVENPNGFQASDILTTIRIAALTKRKWRRALCRQRGVFMTFGGPGGPWELVHCSYFHPSIRRCHIDHAEIEWQHESLGPHARVRGPQARAKSNRVRNNIRSPPSPRTVPKTPAIDFPMIRFVSRRRGGDADLYRCLPCEKPVLRETYGNR